MERQEKRAENYTKSSLQVSECRNYPYLNGGIINFADEFQLPGFIARGIRRILQGLDLSVKPPVYYSRKLFRLKRC